MWLHVSQEMEFFPFASLIISRQRVYFIGKKNLYKNIHERLIYHKNLYAIGKKLN